MNPKEAAIRVGRGLARPFVAYYRNSRELEDWMRSDRERMKQQTAENYINFCVDTEFTIFGMLTEINANSAAAGRPILGEEDRRHLNEILDEGVRTVAAAGQKEGLLRRSTFTFRRDLEAERKIRSAALEVTIGYWEDQLADPDLSAIVLYTGRRRLTQLRGELEQLQDTQTP